MKKLAVIVIMTAITTVTAVTMGSASSGTLQITENTTLTEDHVGNISLEANNITLDCAGHAVSGPGVIGFNGGINGWSRTGTTVKRCVVTAFQYNGIYVTGSDGRYEGNFLYGNEDHGMHLHDGSGNVVIQNMSSSNGGIGIVFTYVTDSLIVDNVVKDNVWAGIALFDDSTDIAVVHNTATGNSEGFQLINAFRNTLHGNTANANRYHGIWLIASDENIIESNRANENKEQGISLADSCSKNIFRKNVANHNIVGFQIVTVNENTFNNNVSNGNSAIGFRVIYGSSFNIFTDNVGRGNGEVDAYEDIETCTENVWSNNNFGRTSLAEY